MSSRQELNSEYPESHTSSVVFMVACDASAANIQTRCWHTCTHYSSH